MLKKTAENYRNFNDTEKYINSRLSMFSIPSFDRIILRLPYLRYFLRYKPSNCVVMVRSGRVNSEMDTGHKIRKFISIQSLYDHFQGFYAFSTILMYAYRRNFSALREDAFSALALFAIIIQNCVYNSCPFIYGKIVMRKK